MRLKAYAKLNLTLDVTGKREDGFHTLDTVMQTVSLWDEVELKESREPGIRLRSNRGYLPVDDRNTAYRAARLFLDRLGGNVPGLEITLEKRVPSRAGMGGGSADAAAVLLGLNEMFSAGLSREELMALGARIGADVPFCVHGGTCRCTGAGERVEPVTPIPDCFFAICKPPAGVSTPRAYALIDSRPLSQKRATPAMLDALEAGDLRLIAKGLNNRFDQVMRLAQVQEVKKLMLRAGALGACMTGSGSAVYGIFDGEQKAKNCVQLLEGRGEVFMAHPIPEN